MKPKPMKPVKAWACVDKKTGRVMYVSVNVNKRYILSSCLNATERIARVVITEEVPKRAH